MNDTLTAFIRESNIIEGIMRDPTSEELDIAREFLALDDLSLDEVCRLQAVFAPGKPLRNRRGMNVRVGLHVPMPGGGRVGVRLANICYDANDNGDPWRIHVAFESLHPFMDGNGRTGRMIWAWMMRRRGADPFALSFLHRFYYQTLENSG